MEDDYSMKNLRADSVKRQPVPIFTNGTIIKLMEDDYSKDNYSRRQGKETPCAYISKYFFFYLFKANWTIY